MRRIAWIIPLALLAALLASLAVRADDDQPDNVAPASALVQTAAVEVRDVSLTLAAYGSVTPGPQGARSVVAARAGEVSAISVLPGAAVQRGEIGRAHV